MRILLTDSLSMLSSWLRQRNDLLGLRTTESLTAAMFYGVLAVVGRPEWASLLPLALRFKIVPRVLNFLIHS